MDGSKGAYFKRRPIVDSEIPRMIVEMVTAQPPDHVLNTENLKRIVHKIGWPTVSKVGLHASIYAAEVVLKADHDHVFQVRCLMKMKELPEGEVRKEDIADLEVRVRSNLDLK